MRILLLNGPNLGRLGHRQPEIYGHITLDEVVHRATAYADASGATLSHLQSNHEGALIDRIHELADRGTEGFIVNFGAYTHTSIALHDALKSVAPRPAIEVHISDIKKREAFRQHSYTAAACIDMISGLGFPGYVKALKQLAKL